MSRAPEPKSANHKRRASQEPSYAEAAKLRERLAAQQAYERAAAAARPARTFIDILLEPDLRAVRPFPQYVPAYIVVPAALIILLLTWGPIVERALGYRGDSDRFPDPVPVTDSQPGPADGTTPPERTRPLQDGTVEPPPL